MSRQVRIIMVAVLVFVGILIFLIVTSDRNDPVHQGRRRSSLYLQYAQANNFHSPDEPSDDESVETLAAMRALGTNALPWLLRLAFDNAPHRPFGSNCLVWVRSNRGGPLRMARGFFPRVPRFVSRLDLCDEAVGIVSQLQVPAKALRSLERITPAGKAAIPVLLDRLPLWPAWPSMDAISVLGNFGPDAAVAVPELERILHTSSQPAMRARAAVALCQIRGEDAEALALIQGGLATPRGRMGGSNAISRDDTFEALARVRAFGEVFASILAAQAERDREGFTERRMSGTIYTLHWLAPEKAAALWQDWMRNDPHEFVRANSAHQLLQIDRTNSEAIAVLCGMIATNLQARTYLLSFLGQASPQSKLAIRTLENVAATNNHPRLRETARQALRQIRHRAEATAPHPR